jgi:hypothetical protein
MENITNITSLQKKH